MKGIRLALKNKPFIILAVTAIVYQLITNIVLANNAYVVSLICGGTTADAGLYLGVMILFMMVWAFLWMRIGKKVSSRNIYRFNFWCLAAASVFTFFVGIIDFIPPNIHYIAGMFLIAPFLGGVTIYSFSMMGSVVDYDELLNNTRREALFYGVFSLASGIGTSLATLILPLLYEAFGYTLENPMGTRAAFLFMGLLAITGALVSYKYCLGDNVKAEETDVIRGEESAVTNG